MNPNKKGILLTNIGTPTQPNTAAVRHFLKKFLSDRRVVKIPKILWWPILHGFILRTRSKKSAELYQQIWTEQGSPLLLYSQSIAQKLQDHLNLPVTLGMHYSHPSISIALKELQACHVKKILILPLYPQYSDTTTASTFDFVANSLKKWRYLPEIRSIYHYYDEPLYIQAIISSLKKTWEKEGSAQHLLFSFHGIPKRYALAGDPYPELCKHTATSVANELQLTNWSISFQSRLGRAQWLTPYTHNLFSALPKQGVNHLHVICPGFATDCLETLEEIAIRGKKQFFQAGGKSFHYISALNDTAEHIDMLAKVVLRHLQDW